MAAYDEAKAKIEALGITEINDSLLSIAVKEAETYIKNFCNITRVPEELFCALVNCACGKYLMVLHSFGQLGDVIDFDTAVSQISEGDVSVSFGNGTSAEDQFLSVISGWVNPDPLELLRFRKLVW